MAVAVVPTIIYSSMMGMTLFALFEVSRKPRQRQTVFLAGLLLLLLAHFLGELFFHAAAYQYAPELAGFHMPVRMLLGPALYFYAFATMSPERGLSWMAYGIALLGPLIVFIGIYPFFFGISPEEKLALADPATRDPDLYKIALFACAFSMSAFISFTAMYLIAAFRLQNRHSQQLMERFSDIEKRSMGWFRGMLVLWGGVWLLFTLEYGLVFIGVRWFGTGVVIPLFEALILLTFIHFSLRQPMLQDTDRGAAKVERSGSAVLPTEKMEEVAEKLRYAMNADELFLENDLSLKRLSEAISVSENHISETLSQFLGTSFFHFVNGYRIEKAKVLLASTDLSVLVVAYDAGFNSKSTFNTAFKKLVGVTPTAYRQDAGTMVSAQ